MPSAETMLRATEAARRREHGTRESERLARAIRALLTLINAEGPKSA